MLQRLSQLVCRSCSDLPVLSIADQQQSAGIGSGQLGMQATTACGPAAVCLCVRLRLARSICSRPSVRRTRLESWTSIYRRNVTRPELAPVSLSSHKRNSMLVCLAVDRIGRIDGQMFKKTATARNCRNLGSLPPLTELDAHESSGDGRLGGTDRQPFDLDDICKQASCRPKLASCRQMASQSVRPAARCCLPKVSHGRK